MAGLFPLAPGMSTCRSRFEPPAQGRTAVELNGARLPDVCINGTGPAGVHDIFVIGDWGGLFAVDGMDPTVDGDATVDWGGIITAGHPDIGTITADHRKEGIHKREWVEGLDDLAQQKVAVAMAQRAEWVDPEYIINVGDNFYWGGVERECGATRSDHIFSSQWENIFEDMYNGPGLAGKQWLGILGNHDYGGYLFTNGWDQSIMYTWKMPATGGSGHWVTPAQYWRSRVYYPDFSVDYFFLDTNVFDGKDPFEATNHNICSIAHNAINATCAEEGGPNSTEDCPQWFQTLWDEQSDWLQWTLSDSTTDWQVVVTHFPPTFGRRFWTHVAEAYGVDLFITGHLHRQEIHADEPDNFLWPTGWIVSGGGGGVTSDWLPNLEGDDSYGFMHLSLSKESITIRNIDHTGRETNVAAVSPRPCARCADGAPAPREQAPRPSQRCAYDGPGCCDGPRCLVGACATSCCGFGFRSTCLAHEELVIAAASVPGAAATAATAWWKSVCASAAAGDPETKAFTVKLTKKWDDKLGLDITQVEERALRILTIHEHGTVAKWNEDNPSQTIEPGDFIVSVNGVRDSSDKLLEELQKEKIELALERILHRAGGGLVGGALLPALLAKMCKGGKAGTVGLAAAACVAGALFLAGLLLCGWKAGARAAAARAAGGGPLGRQEPPRHEPLAQGSPDQGSSAPDERRSQRVAKHLKIPRDGREVA